MMNSKGKFTKWFCLPCKRDVVGDTEGPAATQHLQSEKHIQNVATMSVPLWHCIYCQMWVPQEQRLRHERKITHQSNVSIRQGKIWECEVCGKAMAIDYKMQHLYGKKHLTALSQKSPATQPEQFDTSIPDRDFTRNQKSLPRWEWECEICNKRMQLQDKEPHLRGKVHQDVLESLELPIAVLPSSPAQYEQTEAPISESTHDVEPIVPKWECLLCNKNMPLHDKETHQQGKRHQYFESIALSAISSTQYLGLNPETSNPETSNPETSNPEPPRDQTIVPKWECVICKKHMQLHDKEAHLRGRKHQEVIGSVEPVAIKLLSSTNYAQPTLIPFTQPPQLETPTPESTREQKIVPSWECVICNKRMQLLDKEPHLRGRKHLEVLESLDLISRSPAQYEQPDTTISRPTRDLSVLPKWECVICNKRMQFRDKEPHLRGKSHHLVLQIVGLLHKKPDNLSTKANPVTPTATGSGGIERYTGPSNYQATSSTSSNSKPRNSTGIQKPTVTIDYSGIVQGGSFPPKNSTWSGDFSAKSYRRSFLMSMARYREERATSLSEHENLYPDLFGRDRYA